MSRNRKILLIIGGIAVLLLIAFLVWWWLGRSAIGLPGTQPQATGDQPRRLPVVAQLTNAGIATVPIAQADIVDAGIVGSDSEILDAAGLDRVDQPLGNPAQAKAAGTDGHAVEQQPRQGRGGVGRRLVRHRAGMSSACC